MENKTETNDSQINCYFKIAVEESTRKVGYGFHGYCFNDKISKQGSGCKKATMTKKGYSNVDVVENNFTILNYYDGFEKCDESKTSYYNYFFSIITLIETLITNRIFKFNIFNDEKNTSNFLYKVFVSRNFEILKKEIVDENLFNKFNSLLLEIDKNNGFVEISFVETKEIKNLGITLALMNAKRSVNSQINKKNSSYFKIHDSKGYWSKEKNIDKIFSYPNHYFNPSVNNKSIDGNYFCYYLGDVRDKLQFLGKKISKATFCVLFNKEQEPVLETIRQTIIESNNNANNFYIGYLDKISSSEIYNDIDEFKNNFLLKDNQRERIFYIDNSIISEEIKPPRLTYRVVDMFNSLESILINFMNYTDKMNFIVTEITNEIYDISNDKKIEKKKIKQSINNTVKSLLVDVNYKNFDNELNSTKITLTLNQDLPSRNVLSYLSETDVNVYILTFLESSIAIKYFVVIKSNENYSIWSGVYSNLHFLKLK